MKRFFKNLAIVLSFVLMASIISPAATVVHAAAKITLKSGAAAPATIYAGHSYTLKVAETKVKFTSSNKQVATIGSTTGKLKVIAPGTVKITAKSAKTGKTVATKSFTVRQRATAVSADVTDLYLSVGDTYTIQTTKTPTRSTDVVSLYSEDKTIATVGSTSGKVTAKKDGTTQIKVYSKATKATSNSNKNNKVAYVNVYVGAYMDSAWQTSLTEIAVKFKTDVKDLKSQDFQVMNEKTQVVYPIKSVAADQADSKQFILTVFHDINDGDTYTVKYRTTSASFTATDGHVSSLSITPTSIKANEETEIFVQAKDANGVLLENYSNAANHPSSSYSIKIDPGTNGYLSKDKLVLNKWGAQAQVTAEYHTYEYENSAEKGAITVNATVIANKERDRTVAVKAHLDKKQIVTEQEFMKANSEVSIGESMYAHIKLYTANGKEATDYENYSVMSSDTSILIVEGDIDGKEPIAVVPVKAGSAYILINEKLNSGDNNKLSIPVTVRAKRKPTSLLLDKSNIIMSDSKELNQEAVIHISLLDQYGDKMSFTQKPAVALKSGDVDNTTKVLTDAHYTIRDNQLILFAAKLGKGSYLVDITVENITKTIQIVVKSPADSTGPVRYQIVLEQEQLDSTVHTAEDIDKMIDFKVIEFKGDVSNRAVEIKSIQLSDSKGNDVTDKYVKGNKFVLTSMSKNMFVTATPADTYTLQLTFTLDGKEYMTISRSIVVTNSQSIISYTRISETYQRTNKYKDYELILDILKNNFVFYHDGSTIDNNKTLFAVDDTAYDILETKAVIREISLFLPIKGLDGVYLEYKVPLKD